MRTALNGDPAAAANDVVYFVDHILEQLHQVGAVLAVDGEFFDFLNFHKCRADFRKAVYFVASIFKLISNSRPLHKIFRDAQSSNS